MSPKHIVITGASGGIGSCLLAAALKRWPEAQVYAVGRNQDKLAQLKRDLNDNSRLTPLSFDLCLLEDAEKLAEALSSETSRIDLAIHTIGVLNGSGGNPEKALKELDPAALAATFTINVTSAMNLSRVLKPFFRHAEASTFLTLSAKVGSIGDNNLGGWYAYRMSKAALNMGVRNVALEYKNSGCGTAVVAVHPGTTLTDFSRKFVSKWPEGKVASPETTAERLLDLAEKVGPEDSGKFMHWDGSELPW